MNQTVEFSAKVPKDLYDRFKEQVPAYGGVQWFINAALAGFVAECEADASLKAKVAASVEAMLQLNRAIKEEATV
jgi:hypothetical protein